MTFKVKGYTLGDAERLMNWEKNPFEGFADNDFDESVPSGRNLVCGKPCKVCKGEGGWDYSDRYYVCETCNSTGLAVIHEGTVVRRTVKPAEKVKVQIGCDYLVKEDVEIDDTIIPAGTTLYAWFCGQLVMVVGGLEFPTNPSHIIKLIKANKLELIMKPGMIF